MSRIPYSQARADHEYLWETYGPAEDMTGGYVDQEDLRKLLRSPTKATARDCYVSQIEYWFQMGPEGGGRSVNVPPVHFIDTDPRVREIAERYGYAEASHDAA